MCTKYEGPSFGVSELNAQNEPFNDHGNCASETNLPNYKIPEEDGKNKLTNQENKEDRKFTITELEVWSIIEMEQ